MTMPALISEYRHKTLETAFKKTYSELLQITQYLPYEFGSCSYSNAEDVADFFASKYNKVSEIGYYDKYIEKCKTYNKQNSSARIHFNVLAIRSGDDCSKTSTSNTNGFSCGKFAISNTCPDGSGKTYWDCLP